MSLLMQFKFQPVTKYVRPYGMALLILFYCYPSRVTGSFTLRATVPLNYNFISTRVAPRGSSRGTC